jgi:hypothetical protein
VAKAKERQRAEQLQFSVFPVKASGAAQAVPDFLNGAWRRDLSKSWMG